MADTLGACVVGTGNESSTLTDLVVKRRNEGKSWQSIADEAHAQGLIPKANPNRVKRIHEKWIKSGAKSLISSDVKPATVAKVLDPPVPVGQKIAQGISPSTISKDIPIPPKQIGEVATHGTNIPSAKNFEEFVAQGLNAGKGYKTIAEEAVAAGWIPKVNPNRVKRAAQKLGLAPAAAKAGSGVGKIHGVLPTSQWVPDAPPGIQTKVTNWYNDTQGHSGTIKDRLVRDIGDRLDAEAEELVDFFDTLSSSYDIQNRKGFLNAAKNGNLYMDSGSYHGMRFHIVPPGTPPSSGLTLFTGSADQVKQVKNAIVDNLVGTWAATSSNDHIIALAIQDAARYEFGLDRAVNRIPARLQDDVAQVLNNHGDLMQRYLRAMYENTQEGFRRAGITHVHVYRHMHLSGSSLPPWGQAAYAKRGGVTSRPRPSILAAKLPEGTTKNYLKFFGDNDFGHSAQSVTNTVKPSYTFRRWVRDNHPSWSEERIASEWKTVRREVKAATKHAAGGVIRDDVILQPISSFGIKPQRGFGPYQVRATVSVDRILGTARTGYGCYNEKEFVLMDTPGEMVVTYGGG